MKMFSFSDIKGMSKSGNKNSHFLVTLKQGDRMSFCCYPLATNQPTREDNEHFYRKSYLDNKRKSN